VTLPRHRWGSMFTVAPVSKLRRYYVPRSWTQGISLCRLSQPRRCSLSNSIVGRISDASFEIAHPPVWNIDRVAHSPTAPVRRRPESRIGVEQIVGDVFRTSLYLRDRSLGSIAIGIGDRGGACASSNVMLLARHHVPPHGAATTRSPRRVPTHALQIRSSNVPLNCRFDTK